VEDSHQVTTAVDQSRTMPLAFRILFWTPGVGTH
jgi:hypothetical protein